MSDPHDLQRFVAAQEGIYESAVAELHAGRKTGHWMWIVLLQIAGLGMSAMSQRFAIASLAEARAYLEQPVLGPRLAQCADILIELGGEERAQEIFGGIDAVKLRSSMTLFARASEDVCLHAVLDRYFGAGPIRRPRRGYAGARPARTVARGRAVLALFAGLLATGLLTTGVLTSPRGSPPPRAPPWPRSGPTRCSSSTTRRRSWRRCSPRPRHARAGDPAGRRPRPDVL